MYNNGDISKKEFIEMNYDAVRRLSRDPFINVDSFEKGMFNYQYFNGLAKYYKMLAKELKPGRNFKRYYNEYITKANHFYYKKDCAALEVLKIIDFKNVEAYYIKVNSKKLDDELYEIVLKNFKEAIFHSKAKWLLKVLKEEGVFDNKKRKSLINEYINEKY
ncbi:MAG: hypothetical protein Q4P29_06540 [Tissierellia bacterium]|nr:hypothetical protein [Tissierellia bacterium]